MNEFLTNNLGSVAWWLSVVAIGIILNILSSYFRDAIDKFLSRISGWWSNRSEKRREEISRLVKELSGDDIRLNLFAISEIRDRLLSILAGLMFVLTSLTFFSATSIGRVAPLILLVFKLGLFLFMLIGAFFMLSTFNSAIRKRFVISEVLNKRKEGKHLEDRQQDIDVLLQFLDSEEFKQGLVKRGTE